MGFFTVGSREGVIGSGYYDWHGKSVPSGLLSIIVVPPLGVFWSNPIIVHHREGILGRELRPDHIIPSGAF